jgi:methionine-rich copper-binding protein CopC
MRLALALAAALAVAAALVATAAAHSRPIRFDPPPGAVLSSAPAKVDGWFTSDLRRDPNWTFLKVTDAQGNRVDSGETALSADRRMLSVGLRQGLAAGRYLVTWRGWDDGDGEIFGDCYTFFIGQAAADAAISEKTRLDGGSSCERIEVSARNGTPVPNQSQPSGDAHAEGETGGGGLPLWSLALGIVGGVAAGAAGGRFLGNRR